MYAYIRGALVDLEPTQATIDVQGVGYEIAIPLSTSSKLQLGSETTLYTSFVIRELFQGLFGFPTKQERDLFEILIDISGIGPKTALSLIGHLTLDELQEAILCMDTTTLSKVPGIGKKTAERLLVELKGKLDIFATAAPEKNNSPKNQHMQDALKALVRLGYNPATAQKALKKSVKEGDAPPELGLLITTALRHI